MGSSKVVVLRDWPHIAAVAAAEKNELEFIGVAGASAGALIAVLIAG
jgi:predicted acylesterase/phospholipase RssA